MFCEKCGVKLPENSKFCVSCGAQVGGADAMTAPIPPLPVSPRSPRAAAPIPSPPPPPPPGYQPAAGMAAPSAPPVYRPAAQPSPSPSPAPFSGPGAQGPPSYTPQPFYGAEAQTGAGVLSVGQYIVMFILLCIPIVNIILLFAWSFGSAAPLSKKNFARAALIMGAISVILWIIAGGAIIGILGGMMGGYY